LHPQHSGRGNTRLLCPLLKRKKDGVSRGLAFLLGEEASIRVDRQAGARGGGGKNGRGRELVQKKKTHRWKGPEARKCGWGGPQGFSPASPKKRSLGFAHGSREGKSPFPTEVWLGMTPRGRRVETGGTHNPKGKPLGSHIMAPNCPALPPKREASQMV